MTDEEGVVAVRSAVAMADRGAGELQNGGVVINWWGGTPSRVRGPIESKRGMANGAQLCFFLYLSLHILLDISNAFFRPTRPTIDSTSSAVMLKVCSLLWISIPRFHNPWGFPASGSSPGCPADNRTRVTESRHGSLPLFFRSDHDDFQKQCEFHSMYTLPPM